MKSYSATKILIDVHILNQFVIIPRNYGDMGDWMCVNLGEITVKNKLSHVEAAGTFKKFTFYFFSFPGLTLSIFR